MDSTPANWGRLTPFERFYAPLILGWVRNDEELFWLAPQTKAPLTVEKIEAWTRADDYPFLFWGPDPCVPLGYGELNQMPQSKTHLWLGHLIIAGSQRSKGWGRRLVLALLEQGFVRLGVQEISLVVFPSNEIAIRCYRSCGLQKLGEQYKRFGPAGSRYRMIHMAINAKDYARRVADPAGAEAQEPPG